MTWFQMGGADCYISIRAKDEKLEDEISKDFLLRRLNDVYNTHQVKYGELPAIHKILFKFGMIQVKMALVNFMKL